MNNNPSGKLVNPKRITSNLQILLANRAHRWPRGRGTWATGTALPEGYRHPGRNRPPRTMVGNTRCFGYLGAVGDPATSTVDWAA